MSDFPNFILFYFKGIPFHTLIIDYRSKGPPKLLKTTKYLSLENQKIVFYITWMIERALQKEVQDQLGQFPAVAITGPRQVGKTTLAKQVQKSAHKNTTYLDLELPSDIAKLSNPELFLESHIDDLVIIDEIQRMPELFPLLRALIDKKRSANLGTITKISESLAGRISYIELPPFTRSEVSNRVDIKKHWLYGGYPEALLSQDGKKTFLWLNALIRTYVERDLPLLGFRIPSMELRRFWTMLAHSHGQLWNAQQLAASFGVSPPTATHYRSILEQMFLIRTLKPWHANIKKRMVKTPLVYLCDSGILHALLGIEESDDLLANPIVGKSWEGFVIEQIVGGLKGRLDIAFFRTHAGAEVDLILHKGQKIVSMIEIKLGLAPKISKGFYNAKKDLNHPPAWIIYSGKERYPIATGIEAIGLDKFIISALPTLY